jgi:hypothetical protein
LSVSNLRPGVLKFRCHALNFHPAQPQALKFRCHALNFRPAQEQTGVLRFRRVALNFRPLSGSDLPAMAAPSTRPRADLTQMATQ